MKPSRARIAIALPFILVLFSAISWAAKQPKQPKITGAECLACHADAGMTKEVDGKQEIKVKSILEAPWWKGKTSP